MNFREILGQERAVSLLKNLLKSRRIPPALLLRGPRGTGKAAAARAFADALHCDKDKIDACGGCASCDASAKGLDPDLYRVNAEFQAALLDEEPAKQRSIKVDTVRHLLGRLEMRSAPGRWKVAILENAHLLVPAAANALLKTLEEPPPRTLWLLATHRPDELLSTVRSRCQEVPFMPPPIRNFRKLLDAELPDPAGWLNDPMAPFRLAESLPRELHLARPLASRHLRQMAVYLRASRGLAGYARGAVRIVHRELAEMQQALEANADPRLIIELSALRLQQLESYEKAK
ncbi:MAG: AAA family ATPase [Elusimicrobiota bacterium]